MATVKQLQQEITNNYLHYVLMAVPFRGNDDNPSCSSYLYLMLKAHGERFIPLASDFDPCEVKESIRGTNL